MSDPKIKRVLVSVTDKTGVAAIPRARPAAVGAARLSPRGPGRAPPAREKGGVDVDAAEPGGLQNGRGQ